MSGADQEPAKAGAPREPLRASVDRARDATELHRRAMGAAEAALVSRKAGQHEAATWCYRTALLLEQEAAGLVELEPTRSVLYRSAAHLAIEAGEPGEAIRLADIGLAGDPPAAIREELVATRARASGQPVARDEKKTSCGTLSESAGVIIDESAKRTTDPGRRRLCCDVGTGDDGRMSNARRPKPPRRPKLPARGPMLEPDSAELAAYLREVGIDAAMVAIALGENVLLRAAVGLPIHAAFRSAIAVWLNARRAAAATAKSSPTGGADEPAAG
jgi:hypothetical protein